MPVILNHIFHKGL